MRSGQGTGLLQPVMGQTIVIHAYNAMLFTWTLILHCALVAYVRTYPRGRCADSGN